MKLKDIDKLRKFVHGIIQDLEESNLCHFENTSCGDKEDRIREKNIYTNSENLKKELERLLK